jgi:hypothetical protein
MREIIIPFTATVNEFSVRVIGHERCDGIWEGVIDFQRDSTRLITGVETTQTSADALEYWATGLQPIYLEGALRRTHRPGMRRRVEAALGTPAPH